MSKVVIVIYDDETGVEGGRPEGEEGEDFEIDFSFSPNIQALDIRSGSLTPAQSVGLALLTEFGFEVEDIVEDNYIH